MKNWPLKSEIGERHCVDLMFKSPRIISILCLHSVDKTVNIRCELFLSIPITVDCILGIKNCYVFRNNFFYTKLIKIKGTNIKHVQLKNTDSFSNCFDTMEFP